MYSSESKDIRARLKTVTKQIEYKNYLEKAIEDEQKDAYWNKKGNMSGNETAYIKALEELNPKIPELVREKETLELELNKLRRMYL